MSNDTHDQNQGLDTPDTTPSIFRIIMYAILGYAVVSCASYMFLYGFDLSDRLEEAEENPMLNQPQFINSFPPSAYFTDPFNPDLLPEQVQQANLRQVETPAELGELLGINTDIDIILVDEAVLREEANLIILKQQLGLGKMIVGLRIPLSELGERLDIPVTVPDLQRGQVVNAAVWVSVLRDYDGDGQSVFVELTETFQQIPQMMSTLHELENNVSDQ